MKNQSVGGQVTHSDHASGVVSLEFQVEKASAEIGELFAGARGVDPALDEFGHARTRFYSEAMAS